MAFLPVRSTSGSVQVPQPGHFRLGALGGPTLDNFFPSTHSTVHSPGTPTRPLPARNHSGAGHIFFARNTQALWFLAPRPIHNCLGALEGQTMVFDQITSHVFRLFSPLTRALSDQGARGLHRDGPCNTLASFHLSYDTTFFLPHRVFYLAQMFLPNYLINQIRVTVYG
jgi:hypothetical protein